LTGISKFSKVSIFSDLNHLYDLSNDPDSTTLCGYTQEEIDHYFAPILLQMPPDTRDKMRDWYNGYSWNGKDFVYNPFSVLSFFKARNFQNFWFSTGTPTFLVERLHRDFQYALSDLEVDMQTLEAYELDTLNPIPLLFQTGYLTIKAQTEFDTVVLDYPNREVRQSLTRFLLADYTHQDSVLPRIGQIVQAINGHDLPKTIELFNGLFKAIPNQIFIANREAYFHSVIYLTFILLGVYSQAEVNSSDGRLDAVVYTAERLFIFEFKLHQSADEALQQIIDKDYAAAFKHLNKTITGVGVQFSASEKGIENWVSADI
jgi:Predicted AAA-ATPase/PD-(D/E)XK nuclease superfamily